MSYDKRLTPARSDLAAAHLEGLVEAGRYVAGTPWTIVAGVADLRRYPRADAPVDTQVIHGEQVVLYDENEGWGWVQNETDGYVGYVPLEALGPSGTAATHVVRVNRTFIYPAADMKQPVVAALPLGARLCVDRCADGYAHLVAGGYVFLAHLTPCGDHGDDLAAVAEQLLGAPYLWGGRTPLGIDCSGLVQLSLAGAGYGVARDTDMQEGTVGESVATDDYADLRRGDLIYWRGHVGMMRDAVTLIHANAHHMLVAAEPAEAAITRILANGGGAVTSIRRINKK